MALRYPHLLFRFICSLPPPSGSYATYDVSENAFLPSWYYLFFYSKDARGCRKYHKISDNNMNIFEYVMSLTFWAEGTTVWTVPSLGYSNIVPWRGKVFRIFIERHGKQFTFLNKIVKCLKRVFECSAISSNCKIVPITSSFSVLKTLLDRKKLNSPLKRINVRLRCPTEQRQNEFVPNKPTRENVWTLSVFTMHRLPVERIYN